MAVSKIKKIGVFTSGGDSPGMNAAIRAITRTAIFHKIKVAGIIRGYEGMIDGDIIHLDSSSVSNIIQRGGTILKSARSKRFMTKEGMAKAFKELKKAKIDALVAIGGDGTFKGAVEFSKRYKIPIVGIPGTIDNDLYGTDYTLGYDTAINTAMQAIDKIRDTAASHDRLFFVEVMGRDAGFIALRSGIAGGAEAILVPESKTDIVGLTQTLKKGWKNMKKSMIVVVAEGDEAGGAFEIARQVKEKLNFLDTRVSILGHIQRGGSPTCFDRVLGSRMGVASIENLLTGKKNVMMGLVHKNIDAIPFEKAVKHNIGISPTLLKLTEILSA